MLKKVISPILAMTFLIVSNMPAQAVTNEKTNNEIYVSYEEYMANVDYYLNCVDEGTVIRVQNPEGKSLAPNGSYGVSTMSAKSDDWYQYPTQGWDLDVKGDYNFAGSGAVWTKYYAYYSGEREPDRIYLQLNCLGNTNDWGEGEFNIYNHGTFADSYTLKEGESVLTVLITYGGEPEGAVYHATQDDFSGVFFLIDR